MTIYDVLERIVEQRPFQEFEKQASIKLIRQMRELNVLGTLARNLDIGTHECVRAGPYWPDNHCTICQGPMPAEMHQCSPVIRAWRQGGSFTHCRYCGKDMD